MFSHLWDGDSVLLRHGRREDAWTELGNALDDSQEDEMDFAAFQSRNPDRAHNGDRFQHAGMIKDHRV